MDKHRFVIIGAGGVGGALLDGLARMVQFHPETDDDVVFVVVDGDNFESKNAERQNFEMMGNKAEVRSAEMQPDFDKILFFPDKRWILDDNKTVTDSNSQINASHLIEENDVIYATVDNHAARKAVFDAAEKLDNVDVFTGGNDDKYFGSTYHYQRRNGINITDHPRDYHQEFVSPPDRNPGELSCQERAEIEGGTQLLATNLAVASLLLARTHKTIVKGEEDKQAEIMFDLGVGMAQPYDRLDKTSSEESEAVSEETVKTEVMT